jgi:hypothetical protein
MNALAQKIQLSSNFMRPDQYDMTDSVLKALNAQREK